MHRRNTSDIAARPDIGLSRCCFCHGRTKPHHVVQVQRHSARYWKKGWVLKQQTRYVLLASLYLAKKSALITKVSCIDKARVDLDALQLQQFPPLFVFGERQRSSLL